MKLKEERKEERIEYKSKGYRLSDKNINDLAILSRKTNLSYNLLFNLLINSYYEN